MITLSGQMKNTQCVYICAHQQRMQASHFRFSDNIEIGLNEMTQQMANYLSFIIDICISQWREGDL